MAVRESDIEKYLVEQIEKRGGETRKLKWIGRKNAPDRIVFLNGIHLVECKRPKKEPRKTQQREFEKIEAASGHKVYVINTFIKVDRFIKEITKK